MNVDTVTQQTDYQEIVRIRPFVAVPLFKRNIVTSVSRTVLRVRLFKAENCHPFNYFRILFSMCR